jgi:hypothetical protein
MKLLNVLLHNKTVTGVEYTDGTAHTATKDNFSTFIRIKVIQLYRLPTIVYNIGIIKMLGSVY